MGRVERTRYADSALDDVGGVLASVHPRACDYLAQAPVLAVAACGTFGSHITYGERDRFAAAVSAGPKLRDLMAAYSVPAPAKKLSPAALRIGDKVALRELGRLDASSLAQSIPADSQRVWLDGISKWLRLAPREKRAYQRFNVAWIARHLGADLSRFEQVDALIDFLGRGPGVLNERWTWQTAMQAVETWHRGLRDEAALRRLAAYEREALTFDTVICKSAMPDMATVEGYDFRVLRTLRALREEGAALHHCVASYASSVRSGECTIVSVTRHGVGVATLEIGRSGKVDQVKAHCNAAPSPAARAACDIYALLHWRAPETAA